MRSHELAKGKVDSIMSHVDFLFFTCGNYLRQLLAAIRDCITTSPQFLDSFIDLNKNIYFLLSNFAHS